MTEKEAVKQLGEQIGYGNMMHLASELWKEDMIANGYPISGVFVPALPCDVNRPPLSYVCGECIYFKPHTVCNPDAFDGTIPGNCMMLQVPHPRHKHDPACCQCVPSKAILCGLCHGEKWIDEDILTKPCPSCGGTGINQNNNN